jgi:hypothetical protein
MSVPPCLEGVSVISQVGDTQVELSRIEFVHLPKIRSPRGHLSGAMLGQDRIIPQNIRNIGFREFADVTPG